MTNTSYQKRTAKNNISRYNRSTAYSLRDVYGRYSYAKEQAFRYCLDLMNKYNGRDLKIISYNTFRFTAAFIFNDPETGVIQFMFITPNYDCIVEYEYEEAA